MSKPPGSEKALGAFPAEQTGRVHFRKLLVLVGIALPIGLIPFAGGAGCVVAAVVFRRKAKLDRQRAVEHDPDDPVTAIAAAQPNQVVRVVGRVGEAVEVQAPVSEERVAFATLSVSVFKPGRYSGWTPLFEDQYGATIPLRDETGSAVVSTRGLELMTKHVIAEERTGPLAPGPLRDAVAKRTTNLTAQRYGLRERLVRPGDELSVTARVEKVEQVRAAGATTYRQEATEPRITLGPRGDGTLLATNYDRGDVARLLDRAATLQVATYAWIVVGVVSWLCWLILAFRQGVAG